MHSLSSEWFGELSREDGQRLSGQQGELHASLERIRQWADANPEVFAGVWLDNDAFLHGTGPVRIGVGIAQRELRQVAPALEALVDDPSRLLLVTKDLPERALRDAQDRVVRRWMRPGDADVTSCGVDIHANALTVMLSGPNQALEEQIRAQNADVSISIGHGHVTPRAATR